MYANSARASGFRQTMILSRGSLAASLACALFQQETIVRAQVPVIVARTRFFLEIWKNDRIFSRNLSKNRNFCSVSSRKQWFSRAKFDYQKMRNKILYGILPWYTPHLRRNFHEIGVSPSNLSNNRAPYPSENKPAGVLLLEQHLLLYKLLEDAR